MEPSNVSGFPLPLLIAAIRNKPVTMVTYTPALARLPCYGGATGVSPAGRSSVSAASSSSSSLVSRPCTNAALSVSIACSRSGA